MNYVTRMRRWYNTVVSTYKHGSDVIRKLLGYNGKRCGEEGSVAHRLHDANHEAKRYEGNVPFHFVQHPGDKQIIQLSNTNTEIFLKTI